MPDPTDPQNRPSFGQHLFISYSRCDRTYARDLADALRGRGFPIWIDDRITVGERW